MRTGGSQIEFARLMGLKAYVTVRAIEEAEVPDYELKRFAAAMNLMGYESETEMDADWRNGRLPPVAPIRALLEDLRSADKYLDRPDRADATSFATLQVVAALRWLAGQSPNTQAAIFERIEIHSLNYLAKGIAGFLHEREPRAVDVPPQPTEKITRKKTG